MKAWPLLLVGIGACAEPPRRPPVTYVPIVRGPEAPPPAPTGSAQGAAPAEKEGGTATSIVAVSTEAPPADDAPATCFRKLQNGCCGDAGTPAKKQGGKTVCPPGTTLKKSCKGLGPKCK
jgi:hypothetical protein